MLEYDSNNSCVLANNPCESGGVKSSLFKYFTAENIVGVYISEVGWSKKVYEKKSEI
jgi:hypothetical protein